MNLRIQLFLLVIFSSLCVVNAQYINITKIDVQKYPEINFEYSVFDANGKVIENISSSDIQISERGKQFVASTSDCTGSPQKIDSLSVTLTFDISSSMVANSGYNLNILNKSAKEFLKGITNTYFEAAITSFNHQSFLNSDFTPEYKKLVNILDNLKPNGGTNYQNAFLDPNSGAINVAKNGRFSRSIIFMTDGLPNSIPDFNKIIQEANNNNIKIYCITLGFVAPQYLRDIAEKTGGKWYEDVSTVNKCILTYLDILRTCQNVGPCKLSLTLDKSCDIDRTLYVSIPKYNIGDSIKFQVPFSYLPQFEFTPSNTIEFGSLIPPTSSSTFISIKALNGDLNVKSIKSNNDKFRITNYDGTLPPFTLMQNQSRNITIEYKVTDSALATAKIDIESDACVNNPIYCSGGFKFIAPDEANNPNKIRVVFPNGGETFLAKSDTVLRWDGVTPKDTVTLEYSLDAGESWNLITNQATGLLHKFTMPDTSSNTCLLRVRQIGSVDTTKKDTLIEIGYGELPSIDLSPNEKMLAAGTLYGDVLIIDVASGKIIKEIKTNHYNGHINVVKWSYDGTKLMSGNAEAFFYETTNYTKIDSIMLINSVINFSWSPNNQNFALTKGNNEIYLGRINNAAITDTLKEHTGTVNSIEWNPAGTKLISSSRDANVIVWDMNNKQPEHVFVYIPSIGGSDYITNYANWSPDGKHILFGFGRVYMADGTNYSMLDSIGNTSVYGIKWNKTSDSILIQNLNWELQLYKIENSKFNFLFSTPNSAYAAWLPSRNSIVATTINEHYIKIFDLALKDTTATYRIFNRTVNRVNWSKDGKLISFADAAGNVRVFDVPNSLVADDFKLKHTFSSKFPFNNDQIVTSAKFNSAGTEIGISRFETNDIDIFNMQTGLLSRTLKAMGSRVMNFEWSNNDKLIAANTGHPWIDMPNNGFEVLDASNSNNLYTVKNNNTNLKYSPQNILWSSTDNEVIFDNAYDTLYRYNLLSKELNKYLYIDDTLDATMANRISFPKSLKNRKDTLLTGYNRNGKYTTKWLDLNNSSITRNLNCAVSYISDDESIGILPASTLYNNTAYSVKVYDLENGDMVKDLYLLSVSSNYAFKPNTQTFACGRYGGRVSIWKMNYPKNLKTDVSDTLWRIIRPKAESFDIDMGTIVVNSTKDSVVTSHVKNISEADVTILNIQITGTDAADFELVSGLSTKTVSPAYGNALEYRFKPTTLGKKTADIIITTSNQTLTQRIIGEAIDASLELTVRDIDFGSILVNTTKDSVLFLLTNKNNFPVDITNTVLSGTNADKFRINSGGGTFTLAANSSQQMNLTFLPKNVGRVSANIEFYFNGANSPLVANLYGAGFGLDAYATIQPEDKIAYIGDTIEVPIYLTNLIDVDKSGAEGIVSLLKFNATLLYPLDDEKGYVSDGIRSIPIDVSVQPDQFNVVKRMKFVTLLGNDTITDLKIENSNSYGGRVNMTELPAKVILLGICKEGGPRLVNISNAVDVIKPIPNPANDDFELNYSTIEKGNTNISLYNILGEKLMELVNNEVPTGEHRTKCNLTNVPSGTYMLIMTTETERRSVRFEVIKR